MLAPTWAWEPTRVKLLKNGSNTIGRSSPKAALNTVLHSILKGSGVVFSEEFPRLPGLLCTYLRLLLLGGCAPHRPAPWLGVRLSWPGLHPPCHCESENLPRTKPRTNLCRRRSKKQISQLSWAHIHFLERWAVVLPPPKMKKNTESRQRKNQQLV